MPLTNGAGFRVLYSSPVSGRVTLLQVVRLTRESTLDAASPRMGVLAGSGYFTQS